MSNSDGIHSRSRVLPSKADAANALLLGRLDNKTVSQQMRGKLKWVTVNVEKDHKFLRIAEQQFKKASRFKILDSRPTVFRSMILLDLEEYDEAIKCLSVSLIRPGMKTDELVGVCIQRARQKGGNGGLANAGG